MREPNSRELLAARAIVRTLRACGDDEEKQQRFAAHVLRDHALEVEEHREAIAKLRRYAKYWR